MKLLNKFIRTPFSTKPGNQIVHCSHHKVGTVWFKNVLSAICNYYGLSFSDISKVLNNLEADVIFDDHAKVDLHRLNRSYLGSHMIRDLRDMVISGYHYHLWTGEEWANTRISELGSEIADYWPLLPVNDIQDKTYKEYLNSLDKEDGMIAEIQRASSTDFKDIIDWNYQDKSIFNFKYEDIMLDEEGVFSKIFRHYGFHDKAVEKCVEIAMQFSFKRQSSSKSGSSVSEKSHLRSGKLNQWRDEFSPKHIEYFKELHGQDLINLGYEKDFSW